MVYPGRPVLEPLPQFRGTATVRQTAQQRADLLEFVAREYQAGRSLRQLAELTDRTQTAIRRALDEAGVRRRGRGAQPVSDGPSPGRPDISPSGSGPSRGRHADSNTQRRTT